MILNSPELTCLTYNSSRIRYLVYQVIWMKQPQLHHKKKQSSTKLWTLNCEILFIWYLGLSKFFKNFDFFLSFKLIFFIYIDIKKKLFLNIFK
jgi:hypothetical protein